MSPEANKLVALPTPSEKSSPKAGGDVWLWDVFEEHLDEADFGVMLLEQRLESATASLQDVQRFPESGLRAHVDGLVAGGAEVQARLVRPVLEAPDVEEPFRTTAAALAAIENGDFGALEPALSHPEPANREAVVRAVQLAASPRLDAWIHDRLDRAPTPVFRCGLLRLAATRALPVSGLGGALASEDPELLSAAALAAASGEAAQYSAALERLLDHGDPRVCAAASIGALRWGSRAAWVACERAALDAGDPARSALYAALGGRRHHQRLLERMRASEKRANFVYALGFSGNAAVLPALREQLRAAAELDAKRAAQAIAMISGIDIFADRYALEPPRLEDDESETTLPALEDDDLDAELVPEPEADLPAPNVQSIERELDRLQLDDAKRLLGGRPYGAATLIDYLVQSPLRRHHVLATALEIATAGAFRFDSRAFPSMQLRDLKGLHAANLAGALRAINAW